MNSGSFLPYNSESGLRYKKVSTRRRLENSAGTLYVPENSWSKAESLAFRRINNERAPLTVACLDLPRQKVMCRES